MQYTYPSSPDFFKYLLYSLQAEAYCKNDPRICQVIRVSASILFASIVQKSKKPLAEVCPGKHFVRLSVRKKLLLPLISVTEVFKSYPFDTREQGIQEHF